MKKNILAAALLAAGFLGSAQAALVTVPFQFVVDFADATVATEIGLSTGSLYSGSATVDDSTFAPGQVATATAFSLTFGNFSFTEASDISGFGVGVGLGASNQLTALYFESLFTLVSGAGAGDYLLSFAGKNGSLTPSGDTFDFKLTSSVVPLPATLPLMLAGMAAIGWVAKRRRAN